MKHADWSPIFSEPVQAVLDAVPSMLAYWDNNLKCLFANKAYEKWFGVAGSDLTGTSLSELLGPDLFAANRPHIDGVLAGKPQRFERLVPGPDGINRPSVANYLPHIFDGEVLGFVVEVNDVTELDAARTELRKQVEENGFKSKLLLKSAEALKEAQRVGELGSWHWEVEADIVTWSDQLYVLFGRDPALLPPTYLEHSALYSCASWARLQTAVARALEHGEAYNIELEYKHSSGRRGWLEARGSVLRGETGDVVELVGTARDITGSHAATESEFHAERVASLERLLIDVELEVERLNAAIARSRGLEVMGTIAAGVSHDFNNVLSAVSNGLQVLKLTTGEERSRALAERGQQAVNRATSLVRQLMDLAKAHPPQAFVVDLGELVNRWHEFASTAAGPRIRVVVEPLSLCALVDSYQLEIALLNLVINARDAMPNGGIVTVSVVQKVNIAADDVPSFNSWVGIRVQDGGCGMSLETLAHAREPFFTTKSDSGGTGLGLAMVQAFAQAAGGRMELESEVGVGTAVTILLPAMPRPFDARDKIADTEVALTAELRGTGRILLVDDDDMVRESLLACLSVLGYAVYEASSASEAKNILCENAGLIDLVITDVSMPDETGIEFARWLDFEHPDLQVIFMTGDAGEAGGAKSGILLKPFSVLALARTLIERLGRPF